jgi:uncharacterized damage-inducible protein DinB
MTTASDARRRFEYHAWATRAIADALVDAEPAGRACTIMAHACTADGVWLRRLRGESTVGTELWPAIAPHEVGSLATENAEEWTRYLATLGDHDLAVDLRYLNTAGDEFSTSVGDILEHVLLHGAYHRGQAAAALRAAGVAPPATDYVAWVRLGL